MIDNEEFERRVRNSLGDRLYWNLNTHFPDKIDEAQTVDELKVVLKRMCADILEDLESWG